MPHETLSLTTHSVEQTEALGRRLGAHLDAGDLICLAGTLGAGKTVFTRGLASGWGTTDPVTSPTFTLINVYRRPGGGPAFYHVDCYRLAGESDAWTTGLDDVLDGAGIVVVEWPERIRRVLPGERLWIDITAQADDQRSFALAATGPRPAALLHLLAAQT